MRCRILLVLLAVSLAGEAYSQRGYPTRPRHPRPAKDVSRRPAAPSPIAMSASEIRGERPEVAYNVLSDDAEVVRASLPDIRRIFARRGFDYRESDSATLYGWKQLRLRWLEPTAALSSGQLINYVSGLGKLVVKSTPAGATIELDGTRFTEKTEAVMWPSAGTYRIKLSLNGYEPVEDTCVVEEGKPTRFERKLKPVKKKK